MVSFAEVFMYFTAQTRAMVVELAFNILVGFVIVVVGSYIGAKMALNTFFGRDFAPAEFREPAAKDSDPNIESDSGEQ